MKPALCLGIFSLALIAACTPESETPTAPPANESETTTVETVTIEEVEDGAAAAGGSCLAEIGEQASAKLVDQCIQISPATRPPCNAMNSCGMIRDEISRGCAFGDGSDNADFCADYE